MLWSYAKLESSNSVLFKATANSFVGMNDLNEFKPQEVSNIMWSYATAGEAHPKLFSKLGDHIVAMKVLSGFLQKLAVMAIARSNDFTSQGIANLLWAYATVGIIDLHYLFASFVPAVKSILVKLNSQELANIAWAYAVANVNDPLPFDKDFIDTLQSKAHDFSSDG